MSPADVELSPCDIVQPDVFVVLNAHLDYITPSRIIGAPDLVIELASPSTAPDAHTIEVLKSEGSAFYSLGLFSGSATLPSLVVPDLPVRVEQFYV